MCHHTGCTLKKIFSLQFILHYSRVYSWGWFEVFVRGGCWPPPWLYYQGKYSPLLSLSSFGLPAPTSLSLLLRQTYFIHSCACFHQGLIKANMYSPLFSLSGFFLQHVSLTVTFSLYFGYSVVKWLLGCQVQIDFGWFSRLVSCPLSRWPAAAPTCSLCRGFGETKRGFRRH